MGLRHLTQSKVGAGLIRLACLSLLHWCSGVVGTFEISLSFQFQSESRCSISPGHRSASPTPNPSSYVTARVPPLVSTLLRLKRHGSILDHNVRLRCSRRTSLGNRPDDAGVCSGTIGSCCTVLVIDFNQKEYRLVERNAELPADLRVSEIYSFDPISKADLRRLKREATFRATILGDEPIRDVEEFGGFNSEISHPEFKTRVDEEEADHMNIGTGKGVAVVQGVDVFVELIRLGMVGEWKHSRQSAESDTRVLPDSRDPDGRRHMELRTAIRNFKQSEMQDWRLTGPRVAREWLPSIVDGPGDLTIHHEWVRRSGVLEQSSVCPNHYIFCQVLRAFIAVDQLDPTNLLAAESLIREIVQGELAVSRNPKHPDYTGLDMIIQAPCNEFGSVSVPKFSEWVTDGFETQSNIHKQTRLWPQEQWLRSGRQGDDRPPRGAKGDQGDKSGKDSKGRGRGQHAKKKGVGAEVEVAGE